MFLGCAMLPGLGAEPSIDLRTPQVLVLRHRANQVLSEMKRLCETLHFKFVGPNEFSPAWGSIERDYDGIMSVTGTQVQLGSDAYRFTFREADSRLVSFQDERIGDLPENLVYSDPPDKPKWTPTQAIEMATLFEKIVVEPKDCFLGAPRADYSHGIVDSTTGKTMRGNWMVSWPRVDSKGHPFYGDGVALTMQEGMSPLGVCANLTTPYIEEKTEPMALPDAVAKAQQGIAKKEIDRGFESYDVGDVLLENKFDKADLIVVLPAKDPKVLGGPSSGMARLAWVIGFNPQHSKKPAHPIYNDSFSVWVDAHNGKILGSDGWL